MKKFCMFMTVLACLAASLNSGLSDETKPLVPQPETDSAVLGPTVCPQYKWMDFGSYCSYYSLVHPTCAPVNLNSTNCSLSAPGCTSSTGCVQTLAIAERTDDPGKLGYGHGNAGSAGEKRLRAGKTGGKWPGQDSNLAVTDLDDFHVNFRDVNGDRVQAQIIIVSVKKNAPASGEPTVAAAMGRGFEVRRQNSGDAPINGWIEQVKPIPERPHAYSLIYHPFDGSPDVAVEIFTHHTTPGHAN